MNKRIGYIIAIIVLLAVVCIIEQILVSNNFHDIEKRISNIIVEVGDAENINTQELYDQIVEIEKVWDKYETTLCFFVNLKDIEDVGVELTKMKVYIVENAVEDFKASLSLTLYYLDGYYNIAGISFENIFWFAWQKFCNVIKYSEQNIWGVCEY